MHNFNRGQGLVEYLILVCLLAVSAIGIVSVVGQNLKARYANISSALRGEDVRKQLVTPESDLYEMRGFDDFHESAQAKRGGHWK